MANSATVGGIAIQTPTPTCETATYQMPDEGLSDRRESAHTEQMVVVPQYDNYGYAVGKYDILSASGSEYTVEKTGGDCPDALFNNPDDGCKHYLRVELEQENYPFPYEDEPVADYFEERVLPLLDAFVEDRARLAGERSQLTDADPETLSAYDETLATVDMFIDELSDVYESYRDRVDESLPPVTERVQTVCIL